MNYYLLPDFDVTVARLIKRLTLLFKIRYHIFLLQDNKKVTVQPTAENAEIAEDVIEDKRIIIQNSPIPFISPRSPRPLR